MQIIALPRGRGKTTRLVEQVIEDRESILVVSTAQERHFIIDRLVEADKDSSLHRGKKPSAIQEYWDRRVQTPREALLDAAGRGARNRRVYIDNLDYVLMALFGDIGGVTINVNHNDSITTDGDAE